MKSCADYQAVMLDYLYDLLDAHEGEEFQEHLRQCGPCQAALTRAQAQQRLLAAAAKTAFPEVRFQNPPAKLTVTPPATRGDGNGASSRGWVRWAIAAGLLLVVAGGGVPGTLWTLSYLDQQHQMLQAQAVLEQLQAEARHVAEEHQVAVAQAGKDVEEAQKQLEALWQRHNTKLAELDRALRDRQINVVVSGPETIQPGAPNEYRIQTRNLNNQPVPVQLSARVLTQAQQEVYKIADQPSAGDYRLTLPPNLPFKPASKLSLEVVAKRDGGPQGSVREELPLATPLYVTHLTTDKPMYQPGEVVHFRSLTLERFSLKPAEEILQLAYAVTSPSGEEVFQLNGVTELLDERGKSRTVLLGPDNKPVRGLGVGDFPIAPDAPGGEYTLTVRETNNRFPPQQRKFIINQYEKPRLNKELDFSRKSYGPGEEVIAACRVARAEGGTAVADRPVTATVQVDGRWYGADGKEGARPLVLRTDAKGTVNVRVKLPAAIERGQATLSVTFDDGGSVETLVRPIPIVLKKLQVEFFPEGGDLVAGVPNRIYFQVRTTLGKPADLKGRIVDGEGRVVAEGVHTLNDVEHPGVNQGMGRFEFTPVAGRKYELKIDVPASIESRHELPQVRDDGVVLNIPTGVVAAGEPIRAVVRSAQADRNLLVGAYCRGRLMDHQSVVAKKGSAAEVALKPAQDMGGVYRVTVFEEQAGEGNRRQLVPVAERLLYRLAAERLDLRVQTDRKQYIPGDKVGLTVTAANEKAQPAPAIVMVAVVDRTVLKLADEKTARSMPAHFYLTTEVRRPEDLEYADFLLQPHPKARAALDLLLGTQGWRRFAEQNPNEFRQKFHEDAERLLVTIGQASQKTIDFMQHEVQKVETEFQSKLAQLQQQQAQAQEAWQVRANDPEYPQKMQDVQTKIASAQQQYWSAVSQLDNQRRQASEVRSVVLLVLGVGLAVALLASLAVGLRRSWSRALPYFVATGVCTVLLVAAAAFQFAGSHRLDALAERSRADVGQVAAVDMPVPMAAGDMDKDGAVQWGLVRGRAFPEGAPGVGGGFQGGFGGMMPPGGGMPGAMPGMGAGGMGGPAGPMGRARMALGGKGGDPRAANNDMLNANRFFLQRGQGRQAGVADFERARLGMVEAKEAGEVLKRRKGLIREELRDLQEADKKPAFGRLLLAEPARPNQRGAVLRDEAFRAGVKEEAEVLPQPMFVRQYAHQRSTGGPTEARMDFTETLYWHPVLVLPEGKASMSFDLCDSVTSFDVVAYGHTLDGRLGAVTSTLESRLPFVIEPKIPIEVTAGDRIDIPVSLANNTSVSRPVTVRVLPQGLALREGASEVQVTVNADQRLRQLFRFQPTLVEGEARLLFEGKSGSFSDSILRTFPVVPEGFPVVQARSDLLEKVAHTDVVLPDTWIKGTLKCQVQVYPSTLADLQKGLEALLREPNGCFEQTSTSNYPNLLILNYLKESDQAKPELERRARDLLARGYQKLTSFECLNQGKSQREGYEWFGGTAPPHEALTAYGLLQFRDMARVFDVDPAMLERTRQYLLARKDGKGGFQRNTRALDTFGRAPDDITNAYIVWSLTESGKEDDVTKELAALTEQAKTSKDPYFLALVANSLLNRDRAEEASRLLKTITAAQKPDGHLDAAKTSITGSGGRDLQIETTALAVLGWLKANRPGDFQRPIQEAVKWIGQQRGGHGSFGSTQSTILALKALIAFTKANKKTAEAGEVRLLVGDAAVDKLRFPAGAQEALVLNLPEPEKHLKPGKNSLRVEMTGDKNVFPYTLSWSYQTLKPLSAEGCPVRLATRLDRQTAVEGETVHLSVTVENTSDKGQGMAVAIVGLPAGLTLQEDMKQLKEHARLPEDGKKAGLIGAWETRGREVILYWRDLAPKQKIEVPLDLICRVPGEYRGPASRAYLYYNADHKCWVEPLKMSIQAKAE